jgi:transposase InsO family protein
VRCAASYANEVWQIDHTTLDVWVRVQVKPGVWKEAQVNLTAVLDVFSRAIMAFLVSTRAPDAWTTALALRKAILPKDNEKWPARGLPTVLMPDNGKDFRASSVVSSVSALGIRLEYCPPHHPNSKPEIERWFGTITRGLLARTRGYKGAHMKSAGAAAKHIPKLLTLPALRSKIEAWVVDTYHARPHTGLEAELDGQPMSVWQRTVQLREMAAADLDVLLLKRDRIRKVNRAKLRLKLEGQRGRYYTAPELVEYHGQKVQLRYNPDDMESVLLYDATTGDRICEAWELGKKYTNDDVVQWRHQARKSLAERMKHYAAEIEEDDRKSKGAWDEARDVAVTLSARHAVAPRKAAMKPHKRAPKRSPSLPQPSADVLSLIQRMEQRDRGIA